MRMQSKLQSCAPCTDTFPLSGSRQAPLAACRVKWNDVNSRIASSVLKYEQFNISTASAEMPRAPCMRTCNHRQLECAYETSSPTQCVELATFMAAIGSGGSPWPSWLVLYAVIAGLENMKELDIARYGPRPKPWQSLVLSNHRSCFRRWQGRKAWPSRSTSVILDTGVTGGFYMRTYSTLPGEVVTEFCVTSRKL